MNVDEAICALDSLDTLDPDAARDAAEKILLAAVPFPVKQAHERLVARALWWGDA